MTTYFGGHGLDSYRLTPVQASDAGANGISTNGSAACFVYADMIDPATGLPTSATSLWTHFVFNPDSGVFDNGRQIFYWYNSSDVAVIIATGDSNYGLSISYWNGSGYTLWGDFPNLHGGIFDFYFKVHATLGELNIFLNQTLVDRLGGIDTSAMANIAYLRAGSASGYGDQRFGQCIIASYSTIGHTVRYRRPTGNGPEQDWTGDYTDINGGNINDTVSINTSAIGDISTFTAPDFSATPVGNIIKAVTLGNRVRAVSGGGPQNVQPLVTIGGTDYLAPAVPITAGFNGSIAIFEHDPSTSAPWASVTNVNNPFGVKAVA
jgi:hypothetical protein